MSGYGGGSGASGASKFNIRQRAKDWQKQIAIVQEGYAVAAQQKDEGRGK